VPDKIGVGAFWADAENLFETARQASQSGSPDCDWAILIGPQGDIRMLEAAGWALPSLLAQHGAETAYRVTREGGRVCLEGRRGSQTCLLRSESPAAAARHLLGCRLPPAAWNPPRAALLAEAASTPPTEESCRILA
jgi:hypothetical protein